MGGSTEYLTSAQIIEFFWFFTYFLMFVLAALMKFYIKKEIHSNKETSDSREQQYRAQQRQGTQEIGVNSHDPEIQNINVVANPIHVDIQHNTIQAQLNEKSKTEKFFESVDNTASYYLPILSIAILCINNFASYAFAVACVILYLLSTTLFNEIQIQNGCINGPIKTILRFSSQIWLVALFINYLVCGLTVE